MNLTGEVAYAVCLGVSACRDPGQGDPASASSSSEAAVSLLTFCILYIICTIHACSCFQSLIV